SGRDSSRTTPRSDLSLLERAGRHRWSSRPAMAVSRPSLRNLRSTTMAVEAFDVVDLIHIKRDHGALSTEQINWLVDAYTRGYVADEQMAAMAMAIYLNGMEREEIRDLTLAM